MGRLWLGFYWALPLPNTFGSLWVNFNSPLLWDVFAISTYFTVSLVFWYMGLIPDFAVIRDRAVVQGNKIRADDLQCSKLWMAGWSKNLDALRICCVDPGRSFNTTGTFGSHDCIHGLCNIGYSRMAHDDLPSILRCWCDLLWICNGVNTSSGNPEGVSNLKIISRSITLN